MDVHPPPKVPWFHNPHIILVPADKGKGREGGREGARSERDNAAQEGKYKLHTANPSFLVKKHLTK